MCPGSLLLQTRHLSRWKFASWMNPRCVNCMSVILCLSDRTGMWLGVVTSFRITLPLSSTAFEAHKYRLKTKNCNRHQKEYTVKQNGLLFFLLILASLFSFQASARGAVRVSFPYTPISAASLPWWIAKEARYYEKHGLDVDMIYVGASPVIIQAMLGGQAGVGAGGGPPLVTNVL